MILFPQNSNRAVNETVRGERAALYAPKFGLVAKPVDVLNSAAVSYAENWVWLKALYASTRIEKARRSPPSEIRFARVRSVLFVPGFVRMLTPAFPKQAVV
jgi:hypothetical protein